MWSGEAYQVLESFRSRGRCNDTITRVLSRQNGLLQHSDPEGWEETEHVGEQPLSRVVLRNGGLGKLTDETEHKVVRGEPADRR